jgi:excisionase family DNA binding protein
MDDMPRKTLSIPEAGAHYLGLSRNGSYDAAERGEIPFIQIGRLKRVPIILMERLMESAATAEWRRKCETDP